MDEKPRYDAYLRRYKLFLKSNEGNSKLRNATEKLLKQSFLRTKFAPRENEQRVQFSFQFSYYNNYAPREIEQKESKLQ